jgi:hypothetical protein
MIRDCPKIGLVVSGYFSFNPSVGNPTNMTLQNIGIWDGSKWNNLDGGVPTIESFACRDDGSIFVTGAFASVGSKNVAANYVARWSAASGWEPLGSGLGGEIYDVTGSLVCLVAQTANQTANQNHLACIDCNFFIHIDDGSDGV